MRDLIIQKLKEIEQIEALKAEIAAFPAEHRADWVPLNELFLKTISSQF